MTISVASHGNDGEITLHFSQAHYKHPLQYLFGSVQIQQSEVRVGKNGLTASLHQVLSPGTHDPMIPSLSPPHPYPPTQHLPLPPLSLSISATSHLI